MKMDVPYKILCSFDQDLVNEAISLIEEKDWYVNPIRNTMGNLEQTQSIILRYFNSYDGSPIEDYRKKIINHELYEKYSGFINKVLDHLKNNTDIKFQDYMCFFARLKPKGRVGTHEDNGAFLEQCHRIHIPIVTHPDCKYVIEDVEYHWPVGNVYEFDNTRPHGVINRHNEWRIHFMINLYE